MTPMLIQIKRWLKKPMVWRFVGFASTVIGLVCYALSSPFNHLFKKWNLLKFFVYFVISFIICLMVLFANQWKRLSNHLVDAHLTVVIFTGSSVYSHVFEKALEGKPDAYSLVSCAAFAFMSLSLSRQTYCGFQVDLLNVFLGCLFVLLWKIHLLLAIFGGGGFAYCLTMLRYSLDAQPEDVDLEQGLAVGDSQQANTGSPLHTIPQEANIYSAPLLTFDAPPQNEYLELQDHGVTQVDSHSQPVNTSSPLLTIPQQANTDSALLIMPQFMACITALKKNNGNLIRMLFNHVDEYLKANVDSNIMEISSIPVPQLQSDPNLVVDELHFKIINDLHETVKLMVTDGSESEKTCCQVYSNCRSEFLQECISRFGLQDTEDVDMMERIKRWIKASNIAIRILFPNERRLCDRIFGFSPAADLSFMEVCSELATHLLNFANTCAIEIYSPSYVLEKLTVFETLVDLIPEFKSLFFNQYSVSLMNEAITIRKRLGEAIRGDLENQICLCIAREAVPDGGIHPVTRKVMKFLRYLEEYPADREGTSSSLSAQMASLIELLESNLEAKSKSYTDPALGYVFMMNNRSYIEQEAKFPVGNEWVRKYAAKVWQNVEHYRRSSWDKVLDFLKLDNNESVAPNVAVESIEKKLNLFNMHFNEICSVQSTWFVHDEQLREEIRISLENSLVTSYRKFIGRFQNVLGKPAAKYIQDGGFHIQTQLNGLFGGSKPKEKVPRFSSGFQLAPFMASSARLRLSWNAITTPEPGSNSKLGVGLSWKVHSVSFHEKDLKIIAFETIPVSQHYIERAVISSSDLKEKNFLDFDFLSTKNSPPFYVNNTAVSLLH